MRCLGKPGWRRMRTISWGPLTAIAISLVFLLASPASAGDESEPLLPLVSGVEWQPLRAQALRVAQALELAGAPLQASAKTALDAALAETDPARGVAALQAVFDPLCLAGVNINPESRVKVAAGQLQPHLVQHGWRVFLVKVHNEAGVTAPLRCLSPNAQPLHKPSTGSPDPKVTISPTDVIDRWLDLELYSGQPLVPTLSGLPLEYRLIQLYSRDAGPREAKLAFDVGQGTQDLGFRNEINLLFNCARAVEVQFEVVDDNGQPTTGQFEIRDRQDRIYPARTRRMAPDFFFHDQIYRHSGETVALPPGTYKVKYTRGPEYRVLEREMTVPDAAAHRERFELVRWIKLADHGWYSGDHHVHAAGCKHYESPAEGVQPVDMLRHILGEDLNVGCVLSWGPCWYFQKQYFEGRVSSLSLPQYLMRYDVEVSGFPSSHAGHLCLLRLTEDDYPNTTLIDEWPSWCLPVLEWGQTQGGVVGFSHSGWGLAVEDTVLPSYQMPRFDGIGANEYVVDVVHGACDFISAVDTPIVWELSIWYHTLNCGYTCRISGETDFPCIYGERVGLGRAYVRMNAASDGTLDYDRWVHGIRDGQSYCTDGLSHLFDFAVDGLEVGAKGLDNRASVLGGNAGQPLAITARAAALLQDEPLESVRSRALDQQPYWHVERARIGNTRRVPVDLVVNGQVVETRELEADGHIEDLKFEFTPRQSCWVALRIFPSCHTNPIFVEVGGKPIRASRKSAQWCLDAVDVCWTEKEPKIRESERPAAQAAYDRAREAYRKILAECASE